MDSLKPGHLKADEQACKTVNDLTGNQVGIREVRTPELTQLLTPLDDPPPTTMIKGVIRDSGRLIKGHVAVNG